MGKHLLEMDSLMDDREKEPGSPSLASHRKARCGEAGSALALCPRASYAPGPLAPGIFTFSLLSP